MILRCVALLVALAGTVAAVRWATADSRRDYLTADGWPVHGLAAYRLGADAPQASPDERAVPIASLAKVMTAYLVTTCAPLIADGDGPSITVTAADVRDTAHRRDSDQSVVAVRTGERLDERQALESLLLPSANNVAAMITRLCDPTPASFVARMNATARRLGMTHTTYSDPSGFDRLTVSTASDQLVLARAAGGVPALASIMSMRSARIPVAGTVRNTDSLLGQDGLVGMKTGSDDAAGGCFMFHVVRVVGDRRVELYGVVLGQQGRHYLTAGLYAGRQLAEWVIRRTQSA